MRVVFLRRPGVAALAVLATLGITAPVAAQSPTSERRAAAEKALQRAERLADGRGVRTGRELTTALRELVTQRAALSAGDQREADKLLGRPVDPGDVSQPGGPYSPSAAVYRTCSAGFCVHWVDRTEDAPPAANADACPSTPDYVDRMRRAFEESRDVENGDLGWIDPVSDGTLGGDARTDVYIKELNPIPGEGGLFGYAATDPGQSGDSRHAFLVLDEDYAADEFGEYGGDPTIPVQVTAAHEYNHVLQYAYDVFQDTWMFESTATWAEEQVYPEADDFLYYLPEWAELPDRPLTSDAGLKMYGSAIWNHWLARRYGKDAVRAAWAGSSARGSFAPAAYDSVNGSRSFAQEFAQFAASTAEWRQPEAGIAGGPQVPFDVERQGTLSTAATSPTSVTLDHTSFAVFDVPKPTDSTTPVKLTGSLPPGTRGSVALVARHDTELTVAVRELNFTNGQATVGLPGDPSTFDRISAVLINADTSTDGFDVATGDWDWQKDDQAGTLQAGRGAATAAPALTLPPEAPPSGAEPTEDCGITTLERAAPVVTPTPTPTATPSVTATPTPVPTPTATPTPPPGVDTSVLLSRASARIATVARRARLPFFATVNKAGRLTARATVDRKTAKRLKLGRKRTLGTGRKTMSSAGAVKVNVRLTKKARRAIKRQRRAVKVLVRATFVPADGDPAVTRKLTVRLKR